MTELATAICAPGVAIRGPADKAVALMKLLRVHSWCYLMGIPLLAALHHWESASARPARLAVPFAFAAVYFCWGYVFNNLFDVEEDSKDRNPFKSMNRREALVITLLLQLILIAIAGCSGARLLPETLFVVVLNALYSVPPYRLKRFLVPSLIANGIFFSFPYYASVKLLSGGMDANDVYFTGFIFLLFLPLQYVHFLEHREEQGKRNGLSQRAAAFLFFGVLCAATALAAGHRAEMLLATGTYSAVCLALLLRLESAARARTAVKFASMAFGLYLAFLARFG